LVTQPLTVSGQGALTVEVFCLLGTAQSAIHAREIEL
jgi:hypothetical protein